MCNRQTNFTSTNSVTITYLATCVCVCVCLCVCVCVCASVCVSVCVPILGRSDYTEATTSKHYRCETCKRTFRRLQDISRHSCVTTRTRSQVTRPSPIMRLSLPLCGRTASITRMDGFLSSQVKCVCKWSVYACKCALENLGRL